MNRKNRKLPRLKNYDYSQNGLYFITICITNRQCLLSLVVGNAAPGIQKIKLTEYGKIINSEINKMNAVYQNIQTTNHVIMPNHIHLIVEICKNSGNGMPGAAFPTVRKPAKTLLSDYVGTLKRFCNKKIGQNIWQSSFHDHVIRNEEDYIYHIQYITENPKKWIMGKDEYYT